MAWLSSLLKKPESEEQVQLEDGLLEELPPVPTGPQLAVLAPDVAGISSFRLRFYPAVEYAAADIEAMPPEMRRATHAFWALHDEPLLPDDAHREALVLIRADHTSDVVYVVSFIDLESAWSFARFETKRGLDPSHLIILWAAFAQIREEFDGVSILPPEAPHTKNELIQTIERPAVEDEARQAAREYVRREGPDEAEITDEVETLAPPLRSPAELDAERRAAAAHRDADEAAHIAREAQKELQAARAAADAARLEAEAEATLRGQLEQRMETLRLAEESEIAAQATPVITDELVVIQAPPPGPATSYPGDEETQDDDQPAEEQPAARGTIFRHTAAPEAPKPRRVRKVASSDDPADEFPKDLELDDFDIAYEVERLLQNRRFDTRDEPFNGFKSPPGRF